MSIFVYFAYVGISSCVRNQHPRVFLVAYMSYLVIGIGSFLFHASLKCMANKHVQSRLKA
jgi:dihydroceramidase